MPSSVYAGSCEVDTILLRRVREPIENGVSRGSEAVDVMRVTLQRFVAMPGRGAAVRVLGNRLPSTCTVVTGTTGAQGVHRRWVRSCSRRAHAEFTNRR